jgi:tripartite-type tricarboxylate transporter receptor subunit TctC
MRAIREIILGAVLLAAAGLPASAQSPAEFYKGKTVTILVGSPPGGGYDSYARMLAPYLAKKLDATVIIDNRPGGSGLLALNLLSNSKPDGLTMMHASAEGAALGQLTEREGARWDVTKLNWLARTAEEPKVWFIGAKSRIKSIDEALKADQVTWSATGPADSNADAAAVISHALAIKSRIITGYKGAKDMGLAVVNGEVDAGILSVSAALPLVRSGDLKPLAVVSRHRWHELPDVPTIFEAAKIPADKEWWIDFREKLGQPHRAMVTGPGVPADRVAFLREIWGQVLKDPAVTAEGAKSDRDIAYMEGAELQKLLGDLVASVSGERLEEVRHVILKKYH